MSKKEDQKEQAPVVDPEATKAEHELKLAEALKAGVKSAVVTGEGNLRIDF